ncbi:hypothetical protein SDC9_141857 [bioreactor metagenome]|uniref:Uncharacterized protein n=1 Tax=bioreactor metagenome TaxID=1076179 RepID=A0A645DZM3_9ZZZZ
MRKLHANLMRSPGVQLNIEQRGLLRLTQQRVAQPRLFCASHAFFHHAGGKRRLVLIQPVGQIVLRLRVPVNDRAIALLRLVPVELRGEPRGCLAGLGEHHHTANRAVEPVHEPQIDLARLFIARADVFLEQREQILVAGAVRLHGQVDGLLDHEEVVVLI